MMRKKGKILNNDATVKEERTVPYVYGIIFTLFGIVLSSWFNLNINIIMLWMVYLISSIILININRFWKISAHAMGASIPLGASIGFSQNYFIIFSVILVLVCFARFILKVHTIQQIFAGSFVGFLTTYLLLNYMI